MDNKFILNDEENGEITFLNVSAEMMELTSVPSTSDGIEAGNIADQVIQTFEPSGNANGDAIALENVEDENQPMMDPATFNLTIFNENEVVFLDNLHDCIHVRNVTSHVGHKQNFGSSFRCFSV